MKPVVTFFPLRSLICFSLMLAGLGTGGCGASSDAAAAEGVTSDAQTSPQPQVCAPGLDRCGELCLSLDVDAMNCGVCDNVCDPAEDCIQGVCLLPQSESEGGDGVSALPDFPPEDPCPGAYAEDCDGRCVDTQTSQVHCGGCSNSCGDDQVCQDGVCTDICAPGQEYCDGECVADMLTDRNHCGGCANSCDFSEGCYEGVCEEDCFLTTTGGIQWLMCTRNYVSWEEARAICHERGFDMAYIHSNTENSSADDLIRNNGYQFYWLGLRARENGWIWVWDHSDQVATYFNWFVVNGDPVEPDLLEYDERCVRFRPTVQDLAGGWENTQCEPISAGWGARPLCRREKPPSGADPGPTSPAP